MKEVSVIIPTYNRANFLKEAIDSVLSQTFNNFELIVVDDGSTDNTRDIIAKYSPKIKYIYQPNAGVSAARNRGISATKCRYISFLDSDDLWKPSKLECQVDFMENNADSLISYTEEIWIRKGKRVNPRKRHQKYSGWIFDKVLPLCTVSPSSSMIECSVFSDVGCFDESLPACEDYDFWIRASLKYKISLIKKPLIIKRGGHPDQLSRKIWGLDRFRVKALEKILKAALTPEQRKLVLKFLEEKCHILAHSFFKRGKIEEAAYYDSIPEKYQDKKYPDI